MPRYFIEVAYRGTGYAGFQRQDNANTIQSEVEGAFKTFFRRDFELTGSSRTDAGVHAYQNFFHADDAEGVADITRALYHINSILPGSIVVKGIYRVGDEAHCRFSAESRTYRYEIYKEKNPFSEGFAYFCPYTIDRSVLDAVAAEVKGYRHFEAFSKKSTQVHTYECRIKESRWIEEGGRLVYEVSANRFLRGMVRGLVGSMLRAGRTGNDKGGYEGFMSILRGRVHASADFSVPGHGLYLVRVSYPEGLVL